MKFWTEEFFRTATDMVNREPTYAGTLKGINTSIRVDCADATPSFLIKVEEGLVSTRAVSQGESAEFAFSANYDEWVKIVRDGLKIQGEVVKGRVKFRGSMPKMLLYLGRVARVESDMLAKMRSMSPEF